MADKSLFDENGRLRPVEPNLKKRVKDWFIQGFQLNRCYIPHWDEIKDIFKHYDVDLNRQGPLITLQALKQVRMARKLTEKIKDDPTIRELARRSSFQLRTNYYSEVEEDKIIDGTIFVILLWIIPEFCMEYGIKGFEQFLDNGNSQDFLERAFSTGGTIMESDEAMKILSKEIAKEVSKRND